MQSLENKNAAACPSPEISAYIDGELSRHDEAALESHLIGCRICSDELNLQKNFLNALGVSLEGENEIELPSNFTKAVVANAESRVTGLRGPAERRNALFICSALVVFSLIALGSNVDATLGATAALADKVFAVTASVGHFVYDIALGSAIVFRTLTSNFIFESSVTIVFFLAIFVLSLYAFSRLLVRFHRT